MNKCVYKCIYSLIFVWSVVMVVLILTGCEPKPVILDWFTLEYNKYGGPNEKTVTVNFHAFQDHHPAGYLGTLNLILTDDVWVIDEIVDITPYGNTYTEAYISEGIDYFAENVLDMMNRNKHPNWYWSRGIPLEFENNRYLLTEIKEFSRPFMVPEGW